MRSIVVGTAGHIDHGKTTLVRALTGIDTDRLEEEKRRGISIDLGFAHAQLSADVRAAFIDVPGHERFIRNMLAGAGGIDLVLLVIAADESIKPQTVEHFEICRLLGIRRGAVALTRIDLAGPELTELSRLETEDLVRGTFLENAPMTPVSAVTGEGIDQLRESLVRMAQDVPARLSTRPFRMPVDRAFAMPGFGTVLTGTVVSGSVRSGDEVALLPDGERLRIRGIQVHGASAEAASAGQRAAINIPGIETAEASRGSVLAAPGAFRAVDCFDALFELLPSAKPFRSGARVRIHSGTSESPAAIRTEQTLQPGNRAPVRVRLAEAMVLAPGDRFVVRLLSPPATIGGGEVVDTAPPGKPRWDRTVRLACASVGERIALLAAERTAGMSASDLAVRCGIAVDEVLRSAPASVQVIEQPVAWLLDRSRANATAAEWRAAVVRFHRENPLLPGVGKEEWRSRAMPEAPPFVFEAVLALDPALAVTGDVLHLRTHRLALKEDEERAMSAIENAFRDAGLATPGVNEVLTKSGVDAGRARALLQILFRQGRLRRISEDLVYHPEALTRLRELLAGHRGESFTVGQFKEWTGISRKWAIPLLEFLDRERLTRREGDVRRVL